MDGEGGGYGCVGGCPMHTCTRMLNKINMDASMLEAICNFCACIHVHACMCMCAHVCAHV